TTPHGKVEIGRSRLMAGGHFDLDLDLFHSGRAEHRDRAVLHVRDELARPLDGSVDTPGQQLGRSTPLAIGDVDDLDAELLEQGSSSQVRERTKARYTYLERLALGLGSLGHRVEVGPA